MASVAGGLQLPKTEHRRQYFLQTVEETALMFRITPEEAAVFAERFILMIRAKLRVGDEINFGSGKIFPRVSKPRSFSLINGRGPKDLEKTHFGERTSWRVKFNSRWVVDT